MQIANQRQIINQRQIHSIHSTQPQHSKLNTLILTITILKITAMMMLMGYIYYEFLIALLN